jgi:hypothetical protein
VSVLPFIIQLKTGIECSKQDCLHTLLCNTCLKKLRCQWRAQGFMFNLRDVYNRRRSSCSTVNDSVNDINRIDINGDHHAETSTDVALLLGMQSSSTNYNADAEMKVGDISNDIKLDSADDSGVEHTQNEVQHGEENDGLVFENEVISTEILKKFIEFVKSDGFGWSRQWSTLTHALIRNAPANDGIITLQPARGSPQRVQLVTTPTKASDQQSRRNIQRYAAEKSSLEQHQNITTDNTNTDGFDTKKQMDAAETLAFQSYSNITGEQMRKMRSVCHCLLGYSPFASHDEVQKEIADRNYSFETDVFPIVRTVKDVKKTIKVSYSRMKDIAAHLTKQHMMLSDMNTLFRDNEGRSRILITGDHGGNCTKLAVVLIQNERTQSPAHVIPLATYSAPNVGEDYECMSTVFKSAIEAVENWAKEQIVDVFIGGDMQWLWKMHGMSQGGAHSCDLN